MVTTLVTVPIHVVITSLYGDHGRNGPHPCGDHGRNGPHQYGDHTRNGLPSIWRPRSIVPSLAALPSRSDSVALSPFLIGRMFVPRTYFGHFDEL